MYGEEVVEADDIGKGHAQCSPEENEDEELPIVESDATISPGAMVVHEHDTLPALGTVVRPLRFGLAAFVAVSLAREGLAFVFMIDGDILAEPGVGCTSLVETQLGHEDADEAEHGAGVVQCGS